MPTISDPDVVRVGDDFYLVASSFNAALAYRFFIQVIARQGRWIGAKVGIFAVGKGPASEMGYADYDWFRVE